MTRDYFQWFDPWENHEQQRRYGRQDVLDQIVEQSVPAFREALDRRARLLAADIADQVLEPKMKQQVSRLHTQLSMERALAERLLLSVGPALHSMIRDLQPSLSIEDGPKEGSAVAILSTRETLYIDRHHAFPSKEWRG